MAKKGNILNLKPFPKGKSGNPKGRPKLPNLKEEIAKVMGETKDGVNAVEAVLKSMRAKAMKGDVRAAEFLMDRSYGKVSQDINIDGDLNHTGFDNITFVIKGKED